MDYLKRIKVLYVEDDFDHANLVIKMLEKCTRVKYEIEHQGDLASSIAYLKEINCNTDVILLDLMLPNSEGVNTFKQVYDICGKVPIVIISGFEDIAYQCIELGAQDYLVKPDISATLISRSLGYAIERSKNMQKYKDLVEATNAGIYEIDFINNKFTYVNDVMCKLTGWSRKELMDMGPTEMLTKKSLKDWIERWEALNRGDYIDKTFEYEARMKDGSIVWTLVTAEFQENKEGIVVGARVVAINITNSKMAEEEAKKREDLIFSQLEERIFQWKKEISLKTVENESRLRSITLDINSMSQSEEVL